MSLTLRPLHKFGVGVAVSVALTAVTGIALQPRGDAALAHALAPAAMGAWIVTIGFGIAAALDAWRRRG